MKKLLIGLVLLTLVGTSIASQNIAIRRLGGLVTRTNPLELENSDSTDMSNFTLDEAGTLTERDLFRQYNSASVGNVLTDYVYKFYKSSDAGYLITTTGDKIYKASSGVLTDISTTGSSVYGSQWSWETFKDNNSELVFGANNGSPLVTWDGTGSTFRAETAGGGSTPGSNTNILKKHKSRLWAAGSAAFPYRIYYSSLSDGLNWTTSGGSFDLPSYEKIMALEVLGDILYVFTRMGIYAIVGDTPNEFYIQKTASRVGTHSYKSVQIGGNLIYFLNKSGVYVFDGSSATNISETIQPTIDGISNTYIGSSAGLFDKRGRYWLSFTSTNGSYNDCILVYDTVLKQWYQLDGVNFSSFFKAEGGSDKGEIFCGSANPSGYLWQLQLSSSLEQIVHSTQNQLLSGTTFNTVALSDAKVELTGGNDGNTKLLAHYNTGSTTEDYAHRTITFGGTAALSSTQSKFGGASVYAGDNSSYTQVPDSTDWDLGTGDVTIEGWFRFDLFPAGGGHRYLMSHNLNGSNEDGEFRFAVYDNGGTRELRFYIYNGAGWQAHTATWSGGVVDTWYHIAWVRTSGSAQFYVNGVAVGSATSMNYTLTMSTACTLVMGAEYSTAPSECFRGYLDEMRLSNKARYSTTFYNQYLEFQPVSTGGSLTSGPLQINAAGQSSLGTITWNESLESGTDIQFTTRTGLTNDSVYFNGWETWVSTNVVTMNTVSNSNVWLSRNSSTFKARAPWPPQRMDITGYESNDSVSPSCVQFDVSRGTVSQNIPNENVTFTCNITNDKFIGYWLKSPATGNSVRLSIGEVSPNVVAYTTANTVNPNIWEYHYWPTTGISSSDLNHISYFRIEYLGDMQGELYLGEIHAYDFFDSGDSITSTPNDYIQYRAILGSGTYPNTPRLVSANNYVISISYSAGGGSTESSLTSYWKSKIFDGGNYNNKLWQFVEFFVESENPTTGHTVYMDYSLDDIEKTRLSKTIDVTGSTTKLRFYLPSGSYGKTFQFKFYDNDVDDNLKIKQANISYILEGNS